MSKYDIAIVGMGCVFPEANNVEEYWANIVSGEQFVKDMPEKYWHMDQFLSKDKKNHKTYTKAGCFIKDFPFDPLQYKLPPKSFEGVDISQLVAIEATRQALEDAGIKPHSPELEDAITIIGGSGVDEYAHVSLYLNRFKYQKKIEPYLRKLGMSDEQIEKLHAEFSDELEKRGHFFYPTSSATGAIISSVPNRLAQVFGIKGANMCVDGACASSFVSLSVACHALMAGDAKIAIAGGVDMGINPAIYIGFSRLGGLSENGNTNPFDETANGLVIGEGGGIVVLKRLEDAIADGDSIKAVIRGVGASSDGAGQAIYNPSVKQRSIALQKALDTAQVKASEIQYLEAHATSTVVGDANEYDAISTVYSNRDKNDPLYLGTVKHQIGHLKAAAGVAGLIKTVLAMNKGQVPHMPRFKSLTKYATQKSDSLSVPTELLPWPAKENGKRLAAVTTSGFGGVNYHAIIETAGSYAAPKREKTDRRMAIVGVACRLPGATDEKQFWNNIVNGKELFVDADPKKLGWEENFGANVPKDEKINTRKISLIDDYKIDFVRHKISPNSVSQISPAQLLSVDIADRLLTGHGLDIKENKNIGVSIGSIHDDNYSTISFPLSADEYAETIRHTATYSSMPGMEDCLLAVTGEIVEDGPPHTEATLPGWMSNINAGIVANRLNCNGPNFTVDTACSSGIASMMPAMYQLMFSDVEMMIAGGLNRHTSNVFISTICAMGAMADSIAAPFDESGKGFLTGEGGAVYLLKRYRDAVNAGDNILAVVENVAGSSEYKAKTMLAPSEGAMRHAIAEAVKNSGISPERIGVVDTHGSANLVSDIAEVNAIAKELRTGINAPAVHVTAIKSHVGHIFGGSGATGILSVIQTLRNRTVPGIQNLKKYRPEIEAMLSMAAPQMGNAPLEPQFDAGAVTSLGLGGSNYCLVLTCPEGAAPAAQAPISAPASSGNLQGDVFVATAANEAALQENIKNYLQSRQAKASSSDKICLAVSYDSQAQLDKKLESVLSFMGKAMSVKPLESQGVFFNPNFGQVRGKLAFCFPGQGTHYVEMGRHLYDTNSIFKARIDSVSAFAQKHLSFDLKGLLYGSADQAAAMKGLSTIEGAQISAFAVELALYDLLKSMGIKPDTMLGHSFGEISALAAQGVWDDETAFLVVKARIEASNLVASQGQKLKMLSVACTEDQMKLFLNLGGDDVVLSNIHAPGQYIIAGKEEAILNIHRTAETFGVEAKPLDIASAFHSKFMQPAVEPFRKQLEQFACKMPQIPIISTITGEYISFADSKELADILSRQLVTQLNMPREINRLYRDGVREFLEVGPKWALSKMIEATLSSKDINAVPTLHPKIGDQETFRRAKAYLATIGMIALPVSEASPEPADAAFMDYLNSHEPAVLALLNEARKRFQSGWAPAIAPVAATAARSMAIINAPAPVSKPAAVTAQDISLWVARGKERLSKATGYPIEMLEENLDLEADLGIDSIQRAEIWMSFVKEYGLDENAKPAKIATLAQLAQELAKLSGGGISALSEAAPQPAAASTAADLSIWMKRGKDKLSASTGYPIEMLEENLDLEADLGIDSIQRAEIWLALVKEHGLDENARPAKIATLAQLAEELAKLDGGGAQAPHVPTGAIVAADTEIWLQRARQKISASTGYPEDMLGDSLDLEADLGIDSIQRAEIWLALVKEHGLNEEARPQKIASLMQLAQELAKIAGPEASWQAADVAAAADAGTSAAFDVWLDRGRKKLSAATGYPEEMLEQGLDLEADLGIDSIQRAEIWLALVKEHGLDENARPAKIATLNQLAEELMKLSGGGQSDSKSAAGQTIAAQESIAGAAPVNELFYSSVLPVSKSQMLDFNCKSVLAICHTAKDAKKWEAFFTKLGKQVKAVDAPGFVSLQDSQAASMLEGADTVYILQHEPLHKSSKIGSELASRVLAESHLMYSVFKKMSAGLRAGGQRVVCPVTQDGAFGAGKDSFPLLGSFPAGFIRSLSYEITECKFQIIDCGNAAWADVIARSADILFASIEAGVVSGQWMYPVLSPITKCAHAHQTNLNEGDLVLVTGGARGIVFECVTRLAEKTKCKLLLTGRTDMPQGDEPWLAALPNEIDKLMHQQEIELVKSKKMNLGDAKRYSAQCRSQWEVNYNLCKLKEAGIQVIYEKCDVADFESVRELVKKILANEPIAGIVHGAGVQKSRLFEELAPEAISRTIETKLTPLLAMMEYIDFSQLKFLSAFGSIAGLFGNMGQTDYSLANDALACAVSSISRQYPGMFANTVEWTAWVGTGMATESEAKRFAEMGLNPVTVDAGVDLYDQAVFRAQLPRLAAFNNGAEFASNRQMSVYAVSARPKDRLMLDSSSTVVLRSEDIYVDQHLVQHQPVVPGTFVTEMILEHLQGSGMQPVQVKFRRPMQVRGAELQLEIVDAGGSLLVLPKDRPELEGKALQNLSFAGCGLAKLEPIDQDKLPAVPEKIKKQLLEAGTEVGNLFYEKLDAKFSYVLKSGPIFRGAKATAKDKAAFYGHVYLTDDAMKMAELQGSFCWNPVLADMAIQVAAAWGILDLDVMAIPYEFGQIHILGAATSRDAIVICQAIEQNVDEAKLNITVRDWDGQLIFVMLDVVLKTIPV
jgi:acyl transferase domain-containing protein/NAD(P)-dependent dehydrogenase (short-subunit alcohol dehydrogenase family)/acyl carrier protein